MIACPTVTKQAIRTHYDLATFFYRLLWGRHIHHGLWEASESPAEAQERLTATVADLVGIKPGQKVLDVGCGMGGSSIYLAKNRQAQVTGVTISRFQRFWASLAARRHRVSRNTQFACADAESIEFTPESFDLVWSVECTEHLFDKPKFFERAASWLRPAGSVAICAWLASEQAATDSAKRQKVYDVCADFLCPSLGTVNDYVQWLTQAGLQVESTHDWTSRVTETWEICLRRIRATRMHWLARPFDRDMVRFLDGFENILSAYRTGAMQYGCFIARAPS